MKRLSTGQAIFAVGISWLLVAIVIQCPAFAVRNLKIGAPLTSLFAPNTSGKAGIYESEKLAGRPTAIVFWRPNHKFSLEVLRDIQSIAQNIEPSTTHTATDKHRKSGSDASRRKKETAVRLDSHHRASFSRTRRGSEWPPCPAR